MPADDRAIVFVDANNWFHALERARIRDKSRLDYCKISRKLVQGRSWQALRWYVGRVEQGASEKSRKLYADQRRFLGALERRDRRISVHYGRLERRTEDNDGMIELLKYMEKAKKDLPHDIYWGIHDIAHRHRQTNYFVEKAVDVMLAVDMVTLAVEDKYDTAYLLSADGDYTPAVHLIQARGKKVIPASPGNGEELKRACRNVMVRIDAQWLADCYLDG